MGDTMAELGTCGSCGRPLREGRAFCGGCGAEAAPGPVGQEVRAATIPAPKDPTIRLGSLPILSDCAACGARIEAGSPFCPVCGAPPNGRSSVATLHVAPPVPPVAPQPVASEPPQAAGTAKSGRGRVLVAAAATALVLIAAAGVVMWAGLVPGMGDDPPASETSAQVPSAIADPAIPPDDDIAAMIVPADQLAPPPAAVGEWARVGEFRRTFEAGKPYDRCSGAASPGDARRVTHEYRFASTPTFATEAVTVFADADGAARFFEGEGHTTGGCTQGNGAETPARVAGTDAAVVSTSATANVVRLRKGNVVVTITTDETVPWQPIADKAAARL